ncbi:hypothetical protein EDC01DRAFT_781364 [Geopyxis carbonaria]|nr:hypothetical protein EDC01DRAFT_781364 [Geopyxis carbonaria]
MSITPPASPPHKVAKTEEQQSPHGSLGTFRALTPPPGLPIPAHLYNQCRQQQGQPVAAAAQRRTASLAAQGRGLTPPSDPCRFDPSARQPSPPNPAHLPTLFDLFDPTGITPSYHTLLAAMDYVCDTSVWVTFEDWLLSRGFGFQFWIIVGRNSNTHLGFRRAELLEMLTGGKLSLEMVEDVVVHWEFLWRAASWMAGGGEWEDVGPVRKLVRN